ncbi:hypothetical protein L226DRAFT_566545 [Lentinus tigrinus ALCF2SS1-7]|uniref:F-box domain-containing protein n=1 Tax=Lentinus tigrinus ALCF2SS1-6 TaxID=1328759 RepID=A0A5C2SZR9_9APHY|nr:hypothetical protein L227DRAFT_648855 [Lentinus tigrinus ALCF2SS1-6]RPD80001.1 hypothetical protein L226DRAFT_566545 [Lentinus tigrinus ALCF2SS1-7]
MPGLPLDVLIEIFGHLHPKDLLNLSRASRDFRAFLMNRGNSGLWRAARTNVPGLPECPPFLSEPAYANVVFFSHCHLCLKNAQHPKRVHIEFGARYCKECEAKMLVDRNEDKELDMFLRKIEDFISKNVKQENEIQFPLLFTAQFPSRLLRSQVAEFRTRWMTKQNTKARMKLLKEEERNTKEVETWADEFHAWVEGKSCARRAELSQLKKDRIDGILDRLRQEGWDEEIARTSIDSLKCALRRQKFATRPVALTDSAWQKIRDEANDWMRKIQDRRLHFVKRKILYPRFQVFEKFIAKWTKKNWPSEDDQDEPIPSEGITVVDWLLMPEVQAFLECRDDKEQLTEADIPDDLRKQFVDLAYGWYRDRKADLVDILERELGVELDCSDDPLELAVHSFDCMSCHATFMAFPDVVLHRCGNKPYNGEALIPDYREIATYYGDKWAWNPQKIHVTSRIFPDKVRALISKMGCDPDSATHEAMNKCKTRLTCSDCRSTTPARKYEVFDWNRALIHQDGEEHCSSSIACEWVVLPEEVAERVRDFEANVKHVPKDNSQYPHVRAVSHYYCKWIGCRSHFKYYERDKLFAHLQEEHGVLEREAQEGKDYIKRPIALRTATLPHVYFSHTPSGDILVSLE